MVDGTEQTTRDELVEYARSMHARGLVAGTSGNLSARIDEDRVLVTPSGVDYGSMTPPMIVAVRLDGSRVGDGLLPSVDTANHLAVYRRRPEVRGFVHTHSPHAVAFAIVGRPIPALQIESAGMLGGEVRVMDYLPAASPQHAERVADALGADLAILLPNHGVYAVGTTLATAFATAQIVEDSARVAWLAEALGTPRPLPDGEVARLHDFLHHRYGQRPTE
jgi:ribulose-5-phosphate 4-epimerase/fuculose-1-phosphate aldolase